MQIISFSPFGYGGAMVTIEVDLRRGIPCVDLVGLADNAVREARERMRAAIRNSGLNFPLERVLISLSPADVKKEGAGFDLAMALAVLLEKRKTDERLTGAEEHFNTQILVMGELELSGNLRGVRGVHAAVSTAIEKGIHFCIVPKENEEEALFERGMNVRGVKNLKEAWKIFSGDRKLESIFTTHKKNHISSFHNENETEVLFPTLDSSYDYAQVIGQEKLVRALQIAAAGRHNLIAFGPAGCGKTLALKRFSTILPLLTKDESLPVTRIYSIAGLLSANTVLLKEQPFRIPHQSASVEGMIGGGRNCRPGEISLSHNGVLFLDEAAEFKSSVLQSLRVPLEEGYIVLSRAGRRTCYPACFQLLIASNPCPCGNFGCEDKICLCTPRSVEQYWKRFSAPLLDRVALRVPVFSCDTKKVVLEKNVISSELLRIPIAKAIKIQRKRQGKFNEYLSVKEIKDYCFLSADCVDILENASEQYGFSARAIHSTLKVARTIADMQGLPAIIAQSLLEAIDFRKSSCGPQSLF